MTQTHKDKGQRSRENRGRDCSDAATGQEIPGATRIWKRQGRIPP